ncbi:hypothetical protein [Sphingomonas sp. 8AM]|uniref:hypothetical protein n=1 Tax=Sphingomonas sp. 8AM TaxID=2653170 RepID=UPI0012EFB4B1|nr:hypothetical protein [Sphingomonas sp. 8AM]VXC81757.1 conserved hypothetical protein [Sphingomonas sp. 8AM]
MSATGDIAYFRRRVIEEKYRARAACEEAIRRLHLDLAARYAERAAEAEQRALTYSTQ